MVTCKFFLRQKTLLTECYNSLYSLYIFYGNMLLSLLWQLSAIQLGLIRTVHDLTDAV